MKENEYIETVSIEQSDRSHYQEEVGPIKSTRLFLKEVVQCLENIYDYEKEEYYDVLSALIDRFANTDIINADADDFHNISVQLSRKDEYILAIKVIDVGLRNYPWNTDLLADYIQYGTSICRSENENNNTEYKKIQTEVKECYNKLIRIPRNRWTWRAYSFSIDYLADFLQDRVEPDEADEYLNEAYKFSKAFVKQFASDESYVSLAEVTEKKNGIKASLNILENALNSGELKIAPKCAMRYAEKLFSSGRFDESLKIAQRGIRDAAQTQQKVSLGYLYLLSGLSRISLLESQRQADLTSKKYSKDEVFNIFCDFNIATREFGKRSEYLGIIVSQTNALIDKTSINIPNGKYQELYNLLEENK